MAERPSRHGPFHVQLDYAFDRLRASELAHPLDDFFNWPDRYILATSVGLTPQRKDELLALGREPGRKPLR